MLIIFVAFKRFTSVSALIVGKCAIFGIQSGQVSQFSVPSLKRKLKKLVKYRFTRINSESNSELDSHKQDEVTQIRLAFNLFLPPMACS
jgi:hypothetical protein